MFYCINFKTFLRIKKVKARFMSGSRASKQLTCMYCTYPAYCEPVSKLSSALLRRGEKRNESLQLRLWNLIRAPNSPMAPLRLSCQISANQRKVETNAKKKHVKGNDIISNVISANQHFALTFSMHVFQFQRRS